jgi:hypothetical protein
VTVGRILAQDRDRGAGFLIKPGVGVTAAHTVRGSDAAQILFAPSGGSPVKVAEVELDEKLDRGSTRPAAQRAQLGGGRLECGMTRLTIPGWRLFNMPAPSHHPVRYRRLGHR